MTDKVSLAEEGRSSIRSSVRSRSSTKSHRDDDRQSEAPSEIIKEKPTRQPPTRQPTKVAEDSPEPSEPELTERQRRIQIAKSVGFAFLKSCSSSFGLMLAVIGYSILGGYIFHVLEAQNERDSCENRKKQYDFQEKSIVNRLMDIADTGGDFNTTSVSYMKLLRRFRQIVYEVDYSGDNCSMIGEPGGPNLEWSVSGSTMFAVTITTTIGYGHISPKTFWGKMVCIAYAVLGIPLMLLFLANIGDVLADFFRFFYTKICCCGCCRQKSDSRAEEQDDAGSTVSDASEKTGGPPKREPIVVDDDEDDYDDQDDVTIPLTVTICVITAYIMLGAVLFKIWENWEMGDAAYFSFVTLSTVGFGDFVPGKDGWNDPSAQFNLIMGAVYMVFGMAILSMCFTLIQDEMAAKFAWIGKKLGLIDKQPDPGAEDEGNE